MTTKPKARKFRIRRTSPMAEDMAQHGEQDAPRSVSTPRPEPAPREGEVSSAREASVSENIDEIRHEGLTGRQLRMARRVAQKNGLAPTSDFDAVRLLRAKGIDPFQRATILELVTSDSGGNSGGGGGGGGEAVAGGGRELTDPRQNLPQTVPVTRQTLPSTQLSPAERRSEEIMRLLVRLNEERELTIAMVTHEPDMAEFGTRIVTFKDGHIIDDQPTARMRNP